MTDILWRHRDDGVFQIWRMTDAKITNRTTLVDEVRKPMVGDDPSWSLVGTGDFHNDRKTDILWRHAGDGAFQIWRMDGARIASRSMVVDEQGKPMVGDDPSWHIVGTGDFDADGKADILWRHSGDGAFQIWFMDGARITHRANVVDEQGKPMLGDDRSWSIVGTGDFTGDGKTDILWRHSGDGAFQIWFMDGAKITRRANVVDEQGKPMLGDDRSWSIVGTGDFNADGRTDILWRHRGDGTLQIWCMDGARITHRPTVVDEQGVPMRTEDTSWRIVGTGRFPVQAPAPAPTHGDTVTFDAGPLTSGLPLGGSVHLTVRQNGDFTFSGHAHDSGFDNIDYVISAVLVTASGIAFTFQHAGHVEGTSAGLPFGTPNRNDDFTTTGENPMITRELDGIFAGAHLLATIAGEDTLVGGLQGMLGDLLSQAAEAIGKAAVAAVVALVV